jgi:hypothetical protein
MINSLHPNETCAKTFLRDDAQSEKERIAMTNETYFKVVININNERIQYVAGSFETKEKAVEFDIPNNYNLSTFIVSKDEIFELVNNVFELRKKQSRFSGIPFYSAENFPVVRS